MRIPSPPQTEILFKKEAEEVKEEEDAPTVQKKRELSAPAWSKW